MDVICRPRNPDSLKTIKRLLKQRTAGTKPKTSSLKNASSEVKPKLSSLKNSSLTVEKNTAIITQSKKRKSSEASLECPSVKRSKLDNCQGTLTKMMKSKWSVPFLCPVDRDAAGDYFQVVENPMDFGTIQRNLKQNKYSNDEEFEADVRRVFANATLYHPSNNWVHIYATKLNKLFDILWMSVKPKPASEPIPEKNSSDVSTFNMKNNSLEVEAEAECSPSKVSRVAKMKARFAQTILRAQSKLGNQYVEVKATSQMEEEKCRLKKERELQRQAARASLEQMERSITLDDNLGAMRELEVLMRSRMQVRTKSPLEKLGLFIKPEYQLGYEDDDDLFIQGVVLEEGEILY